MAFEELRTRPSELESSFSIPAAIRQTNCRRCMAVMIDPDKIRELRQDIEAIEGKIDNLFELTLEIARKLEVIKT
jgi:hypothetical protein